MKMGFKFVLQISSFFLISKAKESPIVDLVSMEMDLWLLLLISWAQFRSTKQMQIIPLQR